MPKPKEREITEKDERTPLPFGDDAGSLRPSREGVLRQSIQGLRGLTELSELIKMNPYMVPLTGRKFSLNKVHLKSLEGTGYGDCL